ncbi:MAG: hypothetical protein LBQ30_02125 [Treponema sp.]|jgi:hypothetical protein|nr:hypothetical protein [Treponema sp.]
MKMAFTLYSLLAVLWLAACPVDTGDTPETPGPTPAKTGRITFFNESSYFGIVHQDAFSGPVLLELSAGQLKRVDVRVSDNYGVGSTFPVEYKYRVVEGTDLASGEVWANGIDPNVQLNLVIEENKSYTLQIPQPSNLEFPMAFARILNTSGMQFELHYLGTAFKQAGNGNLPVPPGKTGVYQFSSTAEGKLISGYTVHSTFEALTIPDFTAKHSYIYNFTYSGTTVVKTSEQKILFN